jgi:hypothetical protein
LYIYLPVENDPNLPGTHVTWFDWSGGSGGTPELQRAFIPPGTLENGFQEGPALDANYPNVKPSAQFQIGDWVNGDTGIKEVDDELNKLLVLNREVLLPMYNKEDKDQGKSSFHTTMLGRFRIAGFRLNGSQVGDALPPSIANTSYILLQYLKDATGGTATGCSSGP